MHTISGCFKDEKFDAIISKMYSLSGLCSRVLCGRNPLRKRQISDLHFPKQSLWHKPVPLPEAEDEVLEPAEAPIPAAEDEVLEPAEASLFSTCSGSKPTFKSLLTLLSSSAAIIRISFLFSYIGLQYTPPSLSMKFRYFSLPGAFHHIGPFSSWCNMKSVSVVQFFAKTK